MVLLEMSDNEVTYKYVGDPAILGLLIDAQIDSMNTFQHYATNVVTHIIKDYPDNEKNLGVEKAQEFQTFIGSRLYDIIYANLMTIISPVQHNLENEIPENTAGLPQKKIGMRRVRSLELIKQLL